MRKVYFFAAALVATLTGCDNSEMNNITDSKQVAVEVTAGYWKNSEAMQRRADVSWEYASLL